MKRLVKAYTSFSRIERMGIIAFSLLLLVLIVVRMSMHLWIAMPAATDERLTAAWSNFKSRHTKATHDTVAATAQLFTFDPNTLDSVGFRQLGLRAKTTAILLHWRTKGKVFYHKEDLKDVYTLRPEEYERIAPFVRINSTSQRADH